MKKLKTDPIERMKGNLEEMKSAMKSKRIMMTYPKAKEYIKNKGLNDLLDYNKFYEDNYEECQRIGLPMYPEHFYNQLDYTEILFK